MVFYEIKWFIIRLLLTEVERRATWEAGAQYFDELYDEYSKDTNFIYPTKEAKMVNGIMRGVKGSKNWKYK